MIVFVVHAHWFQVFGLEDLSTFETADVVHAVASRQHLGLFMFAGLHTRAGLFPYSSRGRMEVKSLSHPFLTTPPFEAARQAPTGIIMECRYRCAALSVPWIVRIPAAS